jgi:hypothetical protein
MVDRVAAPVWLSRRSRLSQSDVGFGSIDTFDLLNLIDHKAVEGSLISGFNICKDVREPPASVRMANSIKPAHGIDDITYLSWSDVDQNIATHRSIPPVRHSLSEPIKLSSLFGPDSFVDPLKE